MLLLIYLLQICFQIKGSQLKNYDRKGLNMILSFFFSFLKENGLDNKEKRRKKSLLIKLLYVVREKAALFFRSLLLLI